MSVKRIVATMTMAAVAGLFFAAAPAAAQEKKKLTLLTWNIPTAEELINGWIAEFEAMKPDFEIEWLDKKGTDWATFYQTQVVAGTAPDIIDVQGGLWLDYASSDGLLDLTPFLEKDAEVANSFNADYMSNWVFEGRNYMLPFYISKTLLFYNKRMFEGAGLSGPPETFDDLLTYAAALSGDENTGFMTLNFDWLYWPLFAANGIDLLTPDLSKAAFNTPEMVDVVTKLAAATSAGDINKISWTGRWVEPNGAFAANTVGMLQAHSPAFFYIRGQGDWVNSDTLGVAQAPGGFATPNSHGFGISASTKYPQEAWEFLKLITNEKNSFEFSDRLKVLSGSNTADERLLEGLQKDDPLAFKVLQTQVEETDKQVGNWAVASDARVKDAFWPPIQAALLGQTDPAEAIANAERAVNRALRRR